MTALLRTTMVLLLLLLAGEARAQAGTIRGTVLNVQGHLPLKDVYVIATSPSLQGALEAVTNEAGEYQLLGMPPGVYTLRFESDECYPYELKDLRLRRNSSLAANVMLLPHGVGYGPSEYLGDWRTSGLDFTSSTTGAEPWVPGMYLATNRPGDGASAVRTADGLAPWVPEVTEGLEGFSVQGASPHESDYLLDGLSTRDAATGLNALPVSQELLSYADFLTGGLLPEYGHSTGGILQVQTPNGSDEPRGSVFAHWAPGLLEGWRASARDARAPRHLGDFGATLSGSALQDGHLRFFVGVTPALGRVEHSGPSGTSFIDQRGLQALGRLTYQLHPGHDVSLTVLTAPGLLRGQGATLERSTTHVALHQSSAFQDRRLRLDVHAGWLGLRDSPGRALDQYQARARLTWTRDAHTLKAGVDVEHFVHARTRALDSRESRTPGAVLGGYVQDQWTVLANRLTVHGGLRYGVQLLEAGDSRVTVPLLSPRLGVAYNHYRADMLKLFAHYARYPGLVPLGLLDRATVDERLPVQGASLIDPELEAMASHEAVAGGALTFYESHLSAAYTHRSLDSGLASLRTGSQGGVVLVNPGSGLGAGLPRAERTYNAVTLELHQVITPLLRGHVSYTRSWLRGNHAGPWAGVASTSGPLPGDRPHVLRVYGALKTGLSDSLLLHMGLSYLGASGTPVADGSSRTPWLHNVDARLALDWKADMDDTVTFGLDAFNLFSSQAATQLEPGASGLVPVRHQPPRQLRLGIRYTAF